jgi:hypothetical protein
MNKKKIVDLLSQNHESLITYIDGLPVQEFMFTLPEKWTAGQHLGHILLSVKALSAFFSRDKTAIEQAFGKTNRANRSYEDLIAEYFEKLSGGGKSPERFISENIEPNQLSELTDSLRNEVKLFTEKVITFTEDELDTLLVPHPLLGNLTLREMLYNAIYHPEHHQKLIVKMLIKYEI